MDWCERFFFFALTILTLIERLPKSPPPRFGSHLRRSWIPFGRAPANAPRRVLRHFQTTLPNWGRSPRLSTPAKALDRCRLYRQKQDAARRLCGDVVPGPWLPGRRALAVLSARNPPFLFLRAGAKPAGAKALVNGMAAWACGLNGARELALYRPHYRQKKKKKIRQWLLTTGPRHSCRAPRRPD